MNIKEKNILELTVPKLILGVRGRLRHLEDGGHAGVTAVEYTAPVSL